MFHIRIQRCHTSPHLDQILTGLIELECRAHVTLSVADRADAAFAPGGHHLLTMDVSDESGTRRLVFDMRDGTDVDPGALRCADIYFKRSFDARLHMQTRAGECSIHPYGFNYACTPLDVDRFIALKSEVSINERERTARTLRIARKLAPGLSNAVSRSRARRASFDRFEVAPDAPGNNTVIYVARLWSQNSVPGYDPTQLEALNQGRIDLVRCLKSRFGSRFTGGLENSEIARHMAKDAIFPGNSEHSAYLRLMQHHGIGVASIGLHASVGWKFAEYIAASRCIVAPPLPEGHVTEFTDGSNYLSWDTPETCADACEKLLTDPDGARSMRIANARYYGESLRPDRLIHRHLKFATAGEQ